MATEQDENSRLICHLDVNLNDQDELYKADYGALHHDKLVQSENNHLARENLAGLKIAKLISENSELIS